jgi:cyclophilin family peptidyl-prolyl cis-trans isomerase
VCTLTLVALAVGAAACGGDDDDGSPAPAAETAASAAGSGVAEQCKDVSAPKPKREGGQRKPAAELDPGKTYDVTLRTSCGSFTIRLDQKTSPEAAASFASLARKGFFDGTVFHRIVPDFVIQGGDPTASGTGGPGYSTRDRPPRDTAYTRGVVAMAKTEAEPRGTAGSQFYVVTAQDAGLPPDYAVLGRVVKGLAVTAAIGTLGDPASGSAGTPVRPVVIEKATVSAR